MDRVREIGRLRSNHSMDSRVHRRRTERLRIGRTDSSIENEREEPDREPADARVTLNTVPYGSVVGLIRIFHQTPAIPPSLTTTGYLVIYLLRTQLSRSGPPRSMGLLEWPTLSGFLYYVRVVRRTLNKMYQHLQIGDAVFGRGRRHMQPEPVNLRNAVAKSIVFGLLVLQSRTKHRICFCMLCNRHTAERRAPEPRPRNSMGIDILEVRVRACVTDMVSVLPPIRKFHRPLLCGLHRYVFQFLMYQVISPSWPVPYLQEDMASYGEIDVGSYNPDTQILLFDEPRR